MVKLAAKVLKTGKATKTEARKLAGSVLTQLGKKGERKKGKHKKS